MTTHLLMLLLSCLTPKSLQRLSTKKKGIHSRSCLSLIQKTTQRGFPRISNRYLLADRTSYFFYVEASTLGRKESAIKPFCMRKEGSQKYWRCMMLDNFSEFAQVSLQRATGQIQLQMKVSIRSVKNILIIKAALMAIKTSRMYHKQKPLRKQTFQSLQLVVIMRKQVH